MHYIPLNSSFVQEFLHNSKHNCEVLSAIYRPRHFKLGLKGQSYNFEKQI